MWKPELLAPAKNLERLQVAIAYGADAVYLGGQKYGLRARADNFTNDDLAQGVRFAHHHGAKIYVTLNAFLHDADFEGLEEYCQFLEAIAVDAVIVSDLGVIRRIRSSSNLSIHLSTQASCLNTYAAQVWARLGIQRLIVGRELSIAEAGFIRQQTGMEVEMFAHGAMCMAYSGHCTISNFTAGRDSNRGGCIQSCRLPYHLQTGVATHLVPTEPLHIGSASQTESLQTEFSQAESPQIELVAFMSSKDLWGISQIGEFFQHQIYSLKIEGRMKSSFYVALTCKVYRQLIDAYAVGALDAATLADAAAELHSMPHRDYTSGSLDAPADRTSVFNRLHGINTGSHQYIGMVLDVTAKTVVLRLVEPLAVGDRLEVVPFVGEAIAWTVQQLASIAGESVPSMRQDSVVRVALPSDLERSSAIAKFNVARLASNSPTMPSSVVHSLASAG